MRFRQPLSSVAAARGSAAARLARSVALLLLLVQALVVPAHRHTSAAPPSVITLASTGTAVATPVKQRSDHPADCPVCREVAHAGQYLTPNDVPLPAATAGTLAPSPFAFSRVVADGHSHSWRSRAPPGFGLS